MAKKSFLDFSLSGSKRVVAGLDIGSWALKLLTLESSKGILQLQGFGVKQLPKNTINEKEITDRESLILSIQSLIDDMDTKVSEVVISVCGRKVFTDKFTVRKQQKEVQLREAVMVEAEQRLPMGTEGITLSYFPIADVEDGKRTEVGIVAVREDLVRNYVEAVLDAGLNVLAVDLDGIALYNTFELNYSIPANGIVCIADIGHSLTKMVFLVDGLFYAMRDVSTGMLSVWNIIQSELGFSSDDMERLMLGNYENIDDMKLRAAVYAGMAELKIAMDSSIAYVSSTTEGRGVDRFYLSGGGALLPYITEGLSGRLQAEVEVVNPFQNIQYTPTQFAGGTPESISPLYNIALGLALRGNEL